MDTLVHYPSDWVIMPRPLLLGQSQWRWPYWKSSLFIESPPIPFSLEKVGWTVYLTASTSVHDESSLLYVWHMLSCLTHPPGPPGPGTSIPVYCPWLLA